MGFLDSIFGSNDPATADPNSGLTDFDRRQAAFSTLGSTGALLLAAGQNMLPQQRAQILSGLGNIPAQTQEQLSSMAKTKLMGQQGQLAKQNAAKQQSLEKYLSDPAFLSQLDALPPELKAAAVASAKAGDIGSVTKLLAQNSTDTRQEKLFQQQQILAGRREAQAQAHDDAKPIPLGNGSFFDRRSGMVHTVDPLTGTVSSQPLASTAGGGLPPIPQAAPQAPPAPVPGTGINPAPLPQGMPTAGVPSPLTAPQAALARPPVTPPVTPASGPVMPQGDAVLDPSSGIPLPEPSGRDEDYLKTLPPEYQTLVKRLVNGLQMPPTLSRNNPAMLKAMQMASKYDPSFDTTNYGARAATAKDFASGAAAKNITSLNTAVQHLGTLHELGQKLNNTDYQIVNRGLNEAATQTGDARITNFEATKHAVAEEVSKVFKGSNLSDAEVRTWSGTLNAAMSPAQLQGAIENIVDLMNGRINALGDQYSRGMGGTVPGKQLLDAKSRQKLDFIQSHKIGEKWDTPGKQSAASAPVMVPPAAAAHLKANPALRDAFDQKYGPGASTAILGQ